MARRYPPISERQVAVLAWLAAGCPEDTWEDSTYKRTTYALADRGLVSVDRRRHSWSAKLTDRGRYYLDHGTYPPDPAETTTTDPEQGQHGRRPGIGSRDANDRTGGFDVSPSALLAELQAQSGKLTILDPAPNVRAAYRSAISRAITDDLVPEGYVLRHKGRDHGDLVVRLLPRDEAAPARERLIPIPMPDSLHGSHEAVRQLRDQHPELLDVGPDSRRRALLILRAIADECDRRGHEFALRDDAQPTFQISVGGIVFAFALLEEYERREVPDADELAAAKYEWQRVRSTMQQARSGRLVIRLGERYSATSWADRKRWTLADKLSQLFQHLEQSATQIAQQRAQAERERERRRRAWEDALVQARSDYISDLNRQRLDQQLAAASRSDELRRYADRVEHRAGAVNDPDLARQIHGWAEWVRTEADRGDPLQHPENLSYVEPEEIRDTDLDRFMPRGMKAWRPPD